MSLRRDGLLNRLLPSEIAILEGIPPCDSVGTRWLKDRWVTMWGASDLDLTSVPVALSEDVVSKLNTVCTSKGIPRDAFLDCFLEFLSGRLVDPALVIKDPRTERDLASQIAEIVTDDEMDDSDARAYLLDIAVGWMKGRNLTAWDRSLYEKRLSYDAKKVEDEQLLLEALELL